MGRMCAKILMARTLLSSGKILTALGQMEGAKEADLHIMSILLLVVRA